MNSKLLWVVAVLIVLSGAYYFLVGPGKDTKEEGGDMGSYSYTCDSGAEFSMIPASDVSTIRVTPGAGATFVATTLTQVSGTNSRFEGGDMVFMGEGEQVTLSFSGTILVCTPKSNPDMAPWNWGDSNQSGSVKQDASLVLSETMQGTWRSEDDAKFTRTFKADGSYTDAYEGEPSATETGMYSVVDTTKVDVGVPATAVSGMTVVKLTSKSGDLYFTINEVTDTKLVMTYLGRGNILTFTKVQ